MKKILASLALLLATQVSAETFNRFGASTGVLKGSATSHETTPAESSDIISLWDGTCSSSNFLRGDGSCAPSGTVTSVGLTVPTGLSVTGSPINTSGTLAISTTLNGLLRGTGSGFATATSANVISLWSGTCNSTTFLRADGACISAGGEGGIGSVTSVALAMPTGFSVTGSPITDNGTLTVSTTLNGVLRGTGTGFATATSSNILSLWSGTCSSGTFLRGDGTCASAAAGSTGHIQFNNGGAFASDPQFVFDDASNTLTLTGTANVTTITGNGSGLTSLDAGDISAGTLPVARGGTGTATSTGTGSVVLSASPTLTGTVTAATVSATNLLANGQNVCTANGTNCGGGVSASGIYFPSGSCVANCSLSAVHQHRYIRMGSVVTVSGRVSISVTSGAATLTQVSVSLPIASDFTTAEQAHGSGSNDTNNGAPAFVSTSTGDNRLLLNFYSTSSGGQSVYYTASYEIL